MKRYGVIELLVASALQGRNRPRGRIGEVRAPKTPERLSPAALQEAVGSFSGLGRLSLFLRGQG